jgi:hypothetical protein
LKPNAGKEKIQMTESMSRSTYRVYLDFLETAEKSVAGISSTIVPGLIQKAVRIIIPLARLLVAASIVSLRIQLNRFEIGSFVKTRTLES